MTEKVIEVDISGNEVNDENSKGRRFKCPYPNCPYITTNNCELKTHKPLHIHLKGCTKSSNGKNGCACNKCQYCDYWTVQMANIYEHELAHYIASSKKNLKPNERLHLDKITKESKQLTWKHHKIKHETVYSQTVIPETAADRISSPEIIDGWFSRPYACETPKCPFRSNRSIRSTHKSMHHDPSTRDSTKNLEQCQFCDYWTSDMGSLYDHEAHHYVKEAFDNNTKCNLYELYVQSRKGI